MGSIKFTICFNSELDSFMDSKLNETMDFSIDLKDSEISKLKKLIDESTISKELGLMPILEAGDGLLYDKIDETAQFLLRGYIKHKEEGTLSDYLNGSADYEEFDNGDEYEPYFYICYIPESLYE
jgi:hypothetical protein